MMLRKFSKYRLIEIMVMIVIFILVIGFPSSVNGASPPPSCNSTAIINTNITYYDSNGGTSAKSMEFFK